MAVAVASSNSFDELLTASYDANATRKCIACHKSDAAPNMGPVLWSVVIVVEQPYCSIRLGWSRQLM
jgi:cytochrome c2